MPMRERTPTEKVVDRVRRVVQPVSIVAGLSDGNEQPIDLGEKRGRWERVTRNLSTLDWVDLRCYSEPDGKGKLLDTIANPEVGAEEEEESIPPDDPIAQVERLFKIASAHSERTIVEIRKSDEAYESGRSNFIIALSERNTQLELLAGQSLARLQEAVEMIVTIRQETGSQLSEKEQALLGAIDGLGAKFDLWKPGTIKAPATPQLPAGRSNGSGLARTGEPEET